MSRVAVIVGRFQVPELSDGHKSLFARVKEIYKPDHLVVFMGVNTTKATKRDPLSFTYRKAKLTTYLNNHFYDFTILPIADVSSDEEWYQNFDSLVVKTFPNDEVKLFGSRDSFLDKYPKTGRFQYEIFPELADVCASDIRKAIGQNELTSTEFAKGVIYSLENQYPKVYPTVDIAVYNEVTKEVLLGRKPTETKYRFIGGFVDPSDFCLEAAALREVLEEANIVPQAWANPHSQCEYIASRKINDWRYKNTGDTIHTTFFALKYAFSNPKAGDDLEEIKWFKISDLENITLMPVHNELANIFIRWAKMKGLV